MQKNLNNKNLKNALNPVEKKMSYGFLGHFPKQLTDRLKLKETSWGREGISNVNANTQKGLYNY